MITRFIYPLSLREKISSRLLRFYTGINDKNILLNFNKNLKLDLLNSDLTHRSIILNGFYELALSKTLLKLGAEGGLLVDVGANYGYFSCLWAAQNANNTVLAFEASPLNIEPLRNNVNKNLLSNKVTVIPNAVGKETGVLMFDLMNENKQTGWGGFHSYDDTTSVEVKVETLDNYASKNNITKIDVLKIDTEGADTWVLFGAAKLLKAKKIKNIFFEHNIWRMQALGIEGGAAREFLAEHNYIVEELSPYEFYAYPGKD